MPKLILIDLQHQLVQCSTVQYSTVPKKQQQQQQQNQKYVYQPMIPFTNDQKLVRCLATAVSCEFNWLYNADFR